MEQAGQQLPLRQVTGRPEEDDRVLMRARGWGQTPGHGYCGRGHRVQSAAPGPALQAPAPVAVAAQEDADLKSPNAAPVGSTAIAIRPMFSMSNGSRITVAPSSAAFAAVASMSGALM